MHSDIGGAPFGHDRRPECFFEVAGGSGRGSKLEFRFI